MKKDKRKTNPTTGRGSISVAKWRAGKQRGKNSDSKTAQSDKRAEGDK